MFASAITKTLPNAVFGITIKGDGPTATTLFWPNASGGITFTQSNSANTFHFRDLAITTSQVNSGNALHVIGTAQTTVSILIPTSKT
jgi:hypothetical protein